MWKMLLSVAFVSSEISIMACALTTLDYSKSSITDTEIANAIRDPKPASVDKLIRAIKSIDKYSEIKMLNLSQNNIGLKGASVLLRFILSDDGLPALEKLDLSYNRIKDWRGHDEYEEFEGLLKQLLKSWSFECINLRVNYLGMDWYSYIFKRFSKKLTDKIIFG